MNWKRVFILIASYLSLVGCSSMNLLTRPTMPSVSREPCPPIPRLELKDGQSQVTMGDLYQHDRDLTTLYVTCALRLQAAQENVTPPTK
jgi:hypothetical protein